MGPVLVDEGQELRRTVAVLAGARLAWGLAEAAVATDVGRAVGPVVLVSAGANVTAEASWALVVFGCLTGRGAVAHGLGLRVVAVGLFVYAGSMLVKLAAGPAVGVEAAWVSPGFVLGVGSVVVARPLAAGAHLVERLAAPAATSAARHAFLFARLSLVVLAGLVFDAAFGWWWAELVTAVLVAGLAARAGRRAWCRGV